MAPRVVEEAISRLEELADELRRHGWTATLQTPASRAPCLYVQNPEAGAGALAEHVYAAPKEDGFFYWWSWAEPISPVARGAAEAAGKIMRALRSGPLL